MTERHDFLEPRFQVPQNDCSEVLIDRPGKLRVGGDLVVERSQHLRYR